MGRPPVFPTPGGGRYPVQTSPWVGGPDSDTPDGDAHGCNGGAFYPIPSVKRLPIQTVACETRFGKTHLLQSDETAPQNRWCAVSPPAWYGVQPEFCMKFYRKIIYI